MLFKSVLRDSEGTERAAWTLSALHSPPAEPQRTSSLLPCLQCSFKITASAPGCSLLTHYNAPPMHNGLQIEQYYTTVVVYTSSTPRLLSCLGISYNALFNQLFLHMFSWLLHLEGLVSILFLWVGMMLTITIQYKQSLCYAESPVTKAAPEWLENKWKTQK